jgi:signal transduction histidine kinase
VSLRDFNEGIHPDDREATLAAFAAAADPAQRALYDVEYRTVGKEDGIVRWVAAKGRGHFEGDRCVRIVGVVVEITARKIADARLQELNEHLESRVLEEVAERTRVEDALRQSQKMEAVGQLTGGIAHDFNNMLTGIIGSLDLMQRYIAAGRSDDIGRFTDAAVSSAHRAAALTHRLLAFSRRQSLDLQPLDPNQLVASLEDLFRRTKGAHITLKF